MKSINKVANELKDKYLTETDEERDARVAEEDRLLDEQTKTNRQEKLKQNLKSFRKYLTSLEADNAAHQMNISDDVWNIVVCIDIVLDNLH
jgi:hypothetical protein